MNRYCLWAEYEGQNFYGWQSQKSGLGVQDVLQNAFFDYCGERVLIYGAGRTDSGVHALAQAAHFDLVQAKPSQEIEKAVNFHLAKAHHMVRILAVKKVADDFHARFCAQKRHYIYLMNDRPAPLVLWAKRAWHIPQKLDVKKMSQAASIFIGQHDFTSFRAAQCQSNSPVKHLDVFNVKRKKDLIIIKASARSFLHHQIRSLVGALKMVGLGKLSKKRLEVILNSKDRQLCPQLAPPYGLYLAKIDYPAQD